MTAVAKIQDVIDGPYAKVTNAPPAAGDYALVVRPIGSGSTFSVPALDDDGGPTLHTTSGAVADGLYRAIAAAVIAEGVSIEGVAVPVGFTLSRRADAGGTVPGFAFTVSGGALLIDTLRET